MAGHIKTYPTIDTGVGESQYVSGTNVATNKRAMDAYVKNPTTDPVPTVSIGGTLVTPKIYNITTNAVAGVESSQVLTTGTKRYLIVARTIEVIRLGFNAGESTAGPFLTIPGGASFEDASLDTAPGFTLYFNTPNSGSVVVEILEWT